LGPGALEALLRGVTDQEKAAGYGTAIPAGVLIQKFEIVNGVAYVDFSSELTKGVAGSCRVLALQSQIETTLKNLPDIDSVVTSLNGEVFEVLEP
jgi:spore germination protein GerM